MIKNNLKYVVVLMALVLAAVGCGPAGTPVAPQLEASTESIVANGVESVKFVVSFDGQDVSQKAQIWCQNTNQQLQTPEFTTNQPATYTFYAIYNGLQSNSVEVVASEGEKVPHNSRFERHVCLMDLTGTGCSFCPGGYRTIVSNVTSNVIYKDFVHTLGLHDPSSDNDPMGIELTTKLIADFNVTGTPWYIVDLRDGGSLTQNVNSMTDAIDLSVEEYPAHSDASIKTTLNKDAGTCKVEVKVFAETKDNYRLALFVVEDNIKYPQLDGSVVREDYNHRHVVRQMLSGSYTGDNLGTIEAEKEVTKSYEFAVDREEWNVDNVEVYALVIDGTETVNNVAVCKIDNDSVDYKYLEQ